MAASLHPMKESRDKKTARGECWGCKSPPQEGRRYCTACLERQRMVYHVKKKGKKPYGEGTAKSLLLCPQCSKPTRFRILDTGGTYDYTFVQRRRVCKICGFRLTTREYPVVCDYHHHSAWYVGANI